MLRLMTIFQGKKSDQMMINSRRNSMKQNWECKSFFNNPSNNIESSNQKNIKIRNVDENIINKKNYLKKYMLNDLVKSHA